MNLEKVNRLEIIDHRPCLGCGGKCWIEQEGKKPYECANCNGLGSSGRTVIVAGPAYGQKDNAKMSAELQDDNRTLKIFIKAKDEKDSK